MKGWNITMIKLKIQTQSERKEIIVDANEKIADIFDANDIEVLPSVLFYLNGAALIASDLNQSLAQLGVTSESAMITAVVKATSN